MKRLLYIVAGCVVLALAVSALYCYDLLYGPASIFDRPVTVEIVSGASFNDITKTLIKNGLLERTAGFRLAGRLSGAQRSIKAGEYELRGSQSPMEMIKILTSGSGKYYTITLPEGLNVREIALEFERKKIVKASEFIAKTNNETFIKSLGFETKNLEGYLFPDTYKFTKPWLVTDIIKTMTNRFKEVYSQTLANGALEPNLTRNDIVTLASIIEKETGRVKEMALISAVFHNRLKRNIALQSDPTVIYGIRDFNGNLTRKDLRRATPYNTYVIRGLPAGPITNPGKAALYAALNPAKVSYLYFVSRNNGTHQFSKNLKDHNRAVLKYQKRRRRH